MAKTREIAVVVAIVIYCLVGFFSSRKEISKAKTNLSSLSFSQELNVILRVEDTEEDIEVVPSIATRRPQQVYELPYEEQKQQVYQLPYEEQKGSWIGNHWVPPNGWRYFSAEELRTVYKDKSIMWVGDSLARRAGATMYAILNDASDVNVPVAPIDASSAINVNKHGMSDPCRKWTASCERGKQFDCKHQPRWCRTMPGGVGDYAYLKKYLFSDVIAFFSDELSGKYNITEDFDTIIIAMGNHDKGRSRNSTLSKMTKAINILGKVQSIGKTIIWRTTGFQNNKANSEYFMEINKKAVAQIDSIATRLQHEKNTVSNLTCINWSGAVYPRSFGENRIKGDHPEHYGLQGRLVLIQMITNHLASRQQGKGLY
jgi:hypothetical protein